MNKTKKIYTNYEPRKRLCNFIKRQKDIQNVIFFFLHLILPRITIKRENFISHYLFHNKQNVFQRTEKFCVFLKTKCTQYFLFCVFVYKFSFCSIYSGEENLLFYTRIYKEKLSIKTIIQFSIENLIQFAKSVN
jgi:hypothetical protein